MKTVALLLLSSSLFFSACARRGEKTMVQNTANSGTPQKPQETTTQNQPAITQIRMGRTGCFGKCPIYYVEMQSNGLTSFNGIRYTAHDGVWQKALPASACQAIMRDFEKMQVDTCGDNYDTMVTDLPSISYVFRYADGTAKNIQNASYGPQFLSTLAKEIDELAQVDNTWKKTAEKAEY